MAPRRRGKHEGRRRRRSASRGPAGPRSRSGRRPGCGRAPWTRRVTPPRRSPGPWRPAAWPDRRPRSGRWHRRPGGRRSPPRCLRRAASSRGRPASSTRRRGPRDGARPAPARSSRARSGAGGASGSSRSRPCAVAGRVGPLSSSSVIEGNIPNRPYSALEIGFRASAPTVSRLPGRACSKVRRTSSAPMPRPWNAGRTWSAARYQTWARWTAMPKPMTSPAASATQKPSGSWRMADRRKSRNRSGGVGPRSTVGHPLRRARSLAASVNTDQVARKSASVARR